MDPSAARHFIMMVQELQASFKLAHAVTLETQHSKGAGFRSQPTTLIFHGFLSSLQASGGLAYLV
jgi:hypothetical protein